MRAKGGIEGIDLPVLRELKGRMRAFRNMHSVTVLNVPQLRELSVSVAFVDVKEVKLENASLLENHEKLGVIKRKQDEEKERRKREEEERKRREEERRRKEEERRKKEEEEKKRKQRFIVPEKKDAWDEEFDNDLLW